MKKKLLCFTLALLTLTAMFSVTAFAKAAPKVAVDSRMIEFPDAQPFIDNNGRTLIPVRFVSEAMGADVKWDAASRVATISKGGISVEVAIGNKALSVTEANGSKRTVQMDTTAVMHEGRTYVPIRYVVEALGGYVDFSDHYNMVDIVAPGKEVTADEIKRLRSYDMIQFERETKKANDGASWYTENKDVYDSFNSKFWFPNSHYFLLTAPDTDRDIRCIQNKTEIPAGTHALDFLSFNIDFVNADVERTDFSPTIPGMGTWSGVDPVGGKRSATATFRSDLSLTHQMVTAPQAYVSVRGIMDITFHEPTDLEFQAKKLGFDKLEYEKTYSMDVEYICDVSEYKRMESAVVYRFMPDGSRLAIYGSEK